ncbi:hypothetical protein FSP39_017572 [Pinctada imbricata]|uniref:RING-type domain-containing protein n=1 Tax=Pinctada imbricata TaxID=66713 RepID=A0AA88XI61_PINIB|nr:hypothetical protein FSP39_017572 [Pinctada imbricata]
MASAFGSELTCLICLELFHDPVTLPCMHSFCRKCLESILHSDGERRIPCPACRDVTVLDKAGLRKLPRNFTIANIVSKYRNVDKFHQIPCDLCDEKMQQNAVKSCRECRLSYCMHCLTLHPPRGVLAKHSLIEPKEFVSHEKKFVCLKCSKLSDNDKLDTCQRDHGDDVMDVETAKLKLKVNHQWIYGQRYQQKANVQPTYYYNVGLTLDQHKSDIYVKLDQRWANSKIQGDFVELDDRRRKYLQDIYKTSENLDAIMRKADITRTKLKQICRDKTEKIATDFKRIQDNYDSGVKEVKDKGQGHLLQLKEASIHLHFILPDVKKMLEKTEVQDKVAEKVLPECHLSLPKLVIEQKLAELFLEGAVVNGEKDGTKFSGTGFRGHKEVFPRVTIISCRHNPRKNGESTSVTVRWDLFKVPSQELKFELKFIEMADKEPSNVFIVQNIEFGPQDYCMLYTVDQLQPDITYSVTVAVQGKPETESESTVVHTLPGAQCEPFSLSSSEISRDVFVNREHKELEFKRCFHDINNEIYSRAMGLARGTIMFNHNIYWEVEVSYQLCKVRNGYYVASMGICADASLDAVPNIANNYYFYGVAVGKNEKSNPFIFTLVEGKQYAKYPVKGGRNYEKRFGFFYNASQNYLVIVNTVQDSVLLKTKKLREVMDDNMCYSPVFSVGNGAGYPSIKISTGPDIGNIPTCLLEYLE